MNDEKPNKPVTKEYFDGFIAGIETAVLCAELLVMFADMAPSKKDVAEGLITGFEDAKKKAQAEFDRGTFQRLGVS